ncbi:hypothetical protein KSS87_007152 [Heliosperma pusillum]|nr:hypothetical protein KSS87_007152 [Heliosperma pusillum]
MCSAITLTHKTRHPGFTIDLIHRDSPISPLHNPAKTKWERLSDAFHRSTSRATHFTAASRAASAAQASVVPAGGEYLMNISIGTPPVRMLGIADTGSDLTWTQCKPCVQCYHQSLPIFDPNKSSSYNPVPCGSPTCYTNLASRTCDSAGTCSYYYSYGDKSYTNGVLATEVITFGPHTPPFPGVSIGCGHENDGTFNEKGSGLIGLGGGGLSLISQLKPSIGAQFSYCLVPYFETTSASKISFGPKASVNGLGAVSTPLVKKDPSTFYFLTLESIGIGNVTLDYKTYSAHYYTEEGNIIIDSGTTLTILPKEFYDKLENELEKVIKGERIQDPEGSMGLCYKTKKDLDVPVITARFAGAEVELKAVNTFVRVEEDMACFAMVPASEVAIFGNLAQINFLVGYDLDEGVFRYRFVHPTPFISLLLLTTHLINLSRYEDTLLILMLFDISDFMRNGVDFGIADLPLTAAVRLILGQATNGTNGDVISPVEELKRKYHRIRVGLPKLKYSNVESVVVEFMRNFGFVKDCKSGVNNVHDSVAGREARGPSKLTHGQKIGIDAELRIMEIRQARVDFKCFEDQISIFY